MKEYETLYLVSPEVPAAKLADIHRKLSQAIVNYKGHELSSINLGKKRLAYRVEKHPHGVYVYMNYLGQGKIVEEIERLLKYDDQILKFITVKLDDKVKVEERVKQKRDFVLTTLDETEEVKEEKAEQGVEPSVEDATESV